MNRDLGWMIPALLEIHRLDVVSQTFASWNQMTGWLRQIEGLRAAPNLCELESDSRMAQVPSRVRTPA